MNLELLKLIPEENIKQWTNLTIYCYDIGCICKNCEYFPDDLKKHCQVKLHVLLLYRNLGNPKKYIEEKNERKHNRRRKKSIRLNISNR